MQKPKPRKKSYATRKETMRGQAGGLDVITYTPTRKKPLADLLFVHGAWSSGWYWEDFFLPWFAAKGFRCRACSLRGHGESQGQWREATIADYVEDVHTATAGLECPVILGHSMGGFVVQEYAQKYNQPDKLGGVALLASVPPMGVGLRGFLLGALVTRQLARFGKPRKPDITRRAMFSRGPEDTTLDHHFAKLQPESYRAFLHMWRHPIRAKMPEGIPLLVFSADADNIITRDTVLATAKHYGVQAAHQKGASHMFMVEPGWEDSAKIIHNWIRNGVSGSKNKEKKQ